MAINNKILIIDDNFEQRLVYKQMLLKTGYENLTFFDSAAEALKSPFIHENYDLILMDIMMPELDGIEACKVFKTMPDFENVPIIMVTGLQDVNYLDAAFNAGAHDFITIPFNKVEFYSRVKSAIRFKGIIEDQKKMLAEKVSLVSELTAALENVKTLSGLIPICANCKNIRDDNGYWNQIEVFLKNNSTAEFTHGICPDCVTKLYGFSQKK